MKFFIVSIELTESYNDSAWYSHHKVDLDLENGKVLPREDFVLNNKADYKIEVNISEQNQGYYTKIDYPEVKNEGLFISNELVNFLKSSLLQDKLDTKLVEKNHKEKTKKI